MEKICFSMIARVGVMRNCSQHATALQVYTYWEGYGHGYSKMGYSWHVRIIGYGSCRRVKLTAVDNASIRQIAFPNAGAFV